MYHWQSKEELALPSFFCHRAQNVQAAGSSLNHPLFKVKIKQDTVAAEGAVGPGDRRLKKHIPTQSYAGKE